jgi:hypothetical protein
MTGEPLSASIKIAQQENPVKFAYRGCMSTEGPFTQNLDTPADAWSVTAGSLLLAARASSSCISVYC